MEVTFNNRPQIILFGDSITQRSFGAGGWGASMVNRYARKCRAWLSSYMNCYDTSPNPPLLVTVFFGANDAALPDRGSRAQHVPLVEYKENLRKIVAHLKEANVKHIILITPPPVDIKGRQAYARATYGEKAEELPERTNEAAGQYAQACETVAQETGVSDGLHFTPEGNMETFEQLEQLLDDPNLTPSLNWEVMPWCYPEYSAIDTENPASSLGALDN
ncbi:hypothetical protein AXG93_2091s1180 [Marchantia polymorpha subsp. ruderalis]|uniref:Uncharacterized protein n=1 Tax=Marchantia polymorpha subsp. ruderalis TaxID=1480154 RepID=A0A176W7W2_MARPO|nr:hypothetical protein AXG93_2091s1180 [Marchantia polymorpha subsp. ruderalis]